MKPGDAQTANGILFTDEYQLTMAQLYFRAGLHEQRVRFEHFFRHYPDYGTHKAGYCISAGLEWIVDWMQQSRFRDEDIAYLGGQRGRTGAPLFDADFLAWLREQGTFDGITVQA